METRCPICQKPAPARTENATAPFCSPRCRTIDLGNWLGETYRLPAEDDEGEGEAASRPPEPQEEAAGPGPLGADKAGWRH